jgi:hypothetical protein
MKRQYSKPATQVIKVESRQILCTSGPSGDWYFGQVPGLNPADENLLA